MPSLQDAENSSEDEYDTVPEPSRIENGLSLDTHTKPHESYDEVPLPPMPAISQLLLIQVFIQIAINHHKSPLVAALHQTSSRLLKH
jgi:hypothetical protein